MPRNVYSEINLHLTWHTKHNAPVLVDTVESRAHHYLRHRALETPGVLVHKLVGPRTTFISPLAFRRPLPLPTGSVS
jgi:hypothetical protein